MATKKDVSAFINRLQAKAKIFGIVFEDNRPKNLIALTKLEITPAERERIVLEIKPEDYSEGPKPEDFFGGDAEMYVFGKVVKNEEIYIKITLGRPDSSAICISFHLAEHPMKYPFIK